MGGSLPGAVLAMFRGTLPGAVLARFRGAYINITAWKRAEWYVGNVILVKSLHLLIHTHTSIDTAPSICTVGK